MSRIAVGGTMSSTCVARAETNSFLDALIVIKESVGYASWVRDILEFPVAVRSKPCHDYHVVDLPMSVSIIGVSEEDIRVWIGTSCNSDDISILD
jgi:hypothetical protein